MKKKTCWQTLQFLEDRYVTKKEAEKILNYKNLTIVTEGIWKVKKT